MTSFFYSIWAENREGQEGCKMDLWSRFEMNERITDMWQELGMSAGTAIVVLIALYFVIKWAVKNGMIEAYKKIEEKKTQDEPTTDNDDVSGKN